MLNRLPNPMGRSSNLHFSQICCHHKFSIMILQLQAKYTNNLDEIHANSNARQLVDHLFENSYITIPKAQELLSITYPSAKNVVQVLIKAKILEASKIPYRSKVFHAREIEIHAVKR